MLVQNKPPKCRANSCMKPGTKDGRGLCLICYSEAKKLVEKGETTWDELERLGLVDARQSDLEKALKLKRSKNANNS